MLKYQENYAHTQEVTVLLKGLEKQIQTLQQQNERLSQSNRWFKQLSGVAKSY